MTSSMVSLLIISIAAAVLVVVTLVLALLLARARTATNVARTESAALKQALHRYQSLIDAEAELVRLQREAARVLAEGQALLRHVETTRGAANEESLRLRAEIERLRRELGWLEDEAHVQSFGLYSPRYDFASSELYKQRLAQIREHQKRMLKDGQAATCSTTWVVAGSAKDGKKMTADYLKLMLRAFNGECDAAIAKVKHDNVVAMQERIQKTYDALNRLGTVHQCEVASMYLDLKLQELALFHEYQQKLQAEREEQRAIQEQIREEKRAAEEIERARRQAEQDEQRYQDALEKARAEVERTTGAKQARLLGQIGELETRLAEAQANKQRAISMAEQTRAGHVYVISNIGSFGEHVYKIGMTRRLEPMDRVRELGDASVPFAFDVHAIISTSDAPKLENELHKLFASRRLNTVNLRKEFFAVSITEIESAVHRHHGRIDFTRVAEASEYRASAAMRAGGASGSAPSPAAASNIATPLPWPTLVDHAGIM